MSSSSATPAPGQRPDRSHAATQPHRRAGPAPAWLREPLLHFLLLGGVLFGIDHVIASRTDDPRVVVMGADVDKEARETFKSARGREPDAKELAALRQVWLSNEVLYREGLALQFDKGDPGIRERVIFKALSMVDGNLKPPVPDDAVLRRWFEAHRDKYDEPARFDFQEAALASDANGPGEAAVRSFVTALNAGAPGDAKAGLRVFKGRPHGNLVQSYGAEFAKALESGPVGEWRAMNTQDGWRAMRLDAVTPARRAAFEPLRVTVQQDWLDATMAEQRSAVIQQMAAKYTIRVEGEK